MSRDFGEGLEEALPPFREAELEGRQWEAVSGGVLGRDGVPAEVLDGDAGSRGGVVVDGVEPHVEFGFLVGSEARMAPCEDEAMGRVPNADVANDKGLAVRVGLDQPAFGAGIEGEGPGPSVGELEQAVRLPPLGDLFGEGGEGPLSRGGHSKRDQYP